MPISRPILLALLSAIACTPAASVPTTVTATPAATPGSVASLLAQHPAGGTFTVTGYVNYLYRCPPCPPGAQCKPCMGDNLVVSDAPKPISDYADVLEGDLIVLADRAQLEGLKVGSRYRLEIEIGPRKHLSNPIPDPHLKSATAAPGHQRRPEEEPPQPEPARGGGGGEGAGQEAEGGGRQQAEVKLQLVEEHGEAQGVPPQREGGAARAGRGARTSWRSSGLPPRSRRRGSSLQGRAAVQEADEITTIKGNENLVAKDDYELKTGKVVWRLVPLDEKKIKDAKTDEVDFGDVEIEPTADVGAAFQALAKQGITIKYDQVHKVLGEGELRAG